MSGTEDPSPLSEIETRIALRSFRDLLALAEKKPLEAEHLLARLAHDETAYPDEHRAIHLLGFIAGVLSCQRIGGRPKWADVHVGFKDVMTWKPDDYIGPRRKYGRIR